MSNLEIAPTFDASNRRGDRNDMSTIDPFADEVDISSIAERSKVSLTAGMFSPQPPTSATPRNTIPSSNDNLEQQQATQTDQRNKRLREEAVRRLISDIHRTSNILNPSSATANMSTTPSSKAQLQEQKDLLVASTLATSIERGLDRDLHKELSKEVKESAALISKICHEHSDVFLESVGKVVALGKPCAEIKNTIEQANKQLQQTTGQPMLTTAQTLEYTKSITARARTLYGILQACLRVSLLLERARKQASFLRPRTALDAVEEARTCLTASLSSLVGVGLGGSGGGEEEWRIYFQKLMLEEIDRMPRIGMEESKDNSSSKNKEETTNSNNEVGSGKNNDEDLPEPSELRLEETPFGRRAMALLPKLENEVLLGARRGLNRWFLAIRSGGDGAKAGRAALRHCAHSMAVGPGGLGFGGEVQAYKWRAKNGDNLISRVNQKGKVARAARMGYWYERNCAKEVERLAKNIGGGGGSVDSKLGLERRAEAFACAFGWYRCWDEHAPLDVEESKISRAGAESGIAHSVHGILNRSGHGMNRSGHGSIRSGSSHGRSLGFRAGAAAGQISSHRRDASLSLGRSAHGLNSRIGRDVAGQRRERPQWATCLTPAALFEDAPTRHEDDERLRLLPESVHPVRRAEAAFALLGKTDEFRKYYEQNRFGDMKIGDEVGDDGYEKETRSSLSSLTGDDVSQGTDRIFFAKNLSHFCTSVVGFSAIEAALELDNFQEEEESKGSPPNIANKESQPSSHTGEASGHQQESLQSTSSFRESSAKYERKLITELGFLLRNRAIGATLIELARASLLMVTFRSALKIVHPSSSTRRKDKELLAMDVDIIMTGLKVAQEEQMRATERLVREDRQKEAMRIPFRTQPDYRYGRTQELGEENNETPSNIPEDEVIDFPFGLAELKIPSSNSEVVTDLDEQTRRSSLRYAPTNKDFEHYAFSHSTPSILRSIHARAIAFAAFAQSQQELGQVFPAKKAGGIAGYVLDCVELCVVMAAEKMKNGFDHLDELSAYEAAQMTANISALQSSLPRLFGVLMRGMCHVGMIRADQVEETFEYADSTLASATKACEEQGAGMFHVVYTVCRNKIDTIIHFSITDNSQSQSQSIWVAKTFRETPNTYCESLIENLRTLFKCLKPLDAGSKAGLHFSCCGHVNERLVMLIAGNQSSDDATERNSNDKGDLKPIAKIDAFALKNLSIDIAEFQSFADGTGVPQLRECFSELKHITDAMLDKDLPMLLLPENENIRRRRYPFLKLDKICNILEKYQCQGLGNKVFGSGSSVSEILMMEKKEVLNLIKVVKRQLEH